MKRTLFLCTGNSCRSQMAEGWLRHLAGDQVTGGECRDRPQRPVNSLAVETMKEVGIDISDQHSKPIHEFLNQSFEYVITVCDHAKEECPQFPKTKIQLPWSFDDPAQAIGSSNEQKVVIRGIRDEIGYCLQNRPSWHPPPCPIYLTAGLYSKD